MIRVAAGKRRHVDVARDQLILELLLLRFPHCRSRRRYIYRFLQIIRPLYSSSKTAAITELQIPESSENKFKTEIIPDIPQKKSKPGILICGKSRDQNLDLQLKISSSELIKTQ